MTAPDFEALRAKRNEAVMQSIARFAESEGFAPSDVQTTFNPNACYCACASGGPCEHTWDGKPYESDDGCAWSAACSRCGTTAMSHDMRNMP